MASRTVYKKLAEGRIAVLELPSDAQTNEEVREGSVADKNFAKFRASHAKVLAIYDMFDETKTYSRGSSLRDPSFIYQVGQTVYPDSFFPSTSVCEHGIHYYLSKEGAFCHDDGSMHTLLQQRRYTGIFTRYNWNGNVDDKYHYVNGECVKKQFFCTSNRTHKPYLHEDIPMKNDQYHGKRKVYNEDGLLLDEMLYYKDRLLSSIYYNYDEKNRVVLSISYNGDVRRHGYTTKWEYDDKHNLVLRHQSYYINGVMQ